jgi:RNA polymerase sigma-70 factor (ECF subfamily)
MHDKQSSQNQPLNQQDFAAQTEPYRRELLVHCYRMLGSPLDAEDAVQETLLRAYRRLDTFVRDVSFRAWLYKIATNICLDALKKRRRTLPTTAFPASDPRAALPAPITDPIWIEPLPGGLEQDAVQAHQPAARYEARESVTLAFVAALQLLTPRQRAVLILRDVLNYRAREAASILEMSLSASNSALHRARAALGGSYPGQRPGTIQISRVDEGLLESYVRAWETADIDRLLALLKQEATFAMPPWPVWYQGRVDIGSALRRDIFAGWTPGQDRLRQVQANEQPAFALYRREPQSGLYRATGIQVLTVAPQESKFLDVTVFLNPGLFPAFGLPEELSL